MHEKRPTIVLQAWCLAALLVLVSLGCGLKTGQKNSLQEPLAPRTTLQDPLVLRTDALYDRLVLAGGGKTQPVQVLDLNSPHIRGQGIRILTARGHNAELRALGGSVSINVYVWESSEKAIKALAGSFAGSSAPADMVDSWVGNNFGDACVGKDTDQAVSFVRGNIVVYVQRLPGNQIGSAAAIARAVDAAILASVGLPRPNDGSRFIYSSDPVASLPAPAPRPTPLETPAPPKASNPLPATLPVALAPTVPDAKDVAPTAPVPHTATTPNQLAKPPEAGPSEDTERPPLSEKPASPQDEPVVNVPTPGPKPVADSAQNTSGMVWLYVGLLAAGVLGGGLVAWYKLLHRAQGRPRSS